MAHSSPGFVRHRGSLHPAHLKTREFAAPDVAHARKTKAVATAFLRRAVHTSARIVRVSDDALEYSSGGFCALFVHCPACCAFAQPYAPVLSPTFSQTPCRRRIVYVSLATTRALALRRKGRQQREQVPVVRSAGHRLSERKGQNGGGEESDRKKANRVRVRPPAVCVVFVLSLCCDRLRCAFTFPLFCFVFDLVDVHISTKLLRLVPTTPRGVQFSGLGRGNGQDILAASSCRLAAAASAAAAASCCFCLFVCRFSPLAVCCLFL